jgi:hypothetical protein
MHCAPLLCPGGEWREDEAERENAREPDEPHSCRGV